MPDPTANKAEYLFEKLCLQEGILFERIQEANERRPDYRLLFKNTEIIVEVKEIEPNAEEKAIIEADPESIDPKKFFIGGCLVNE